MTTEKNYFKELSKIDISKHVEKKGKFNYLSWAYAVKTLKEYDPTATWEVKRFEGIPYLRTELGYFVEVEVTVQGITHSQIHPVLNNYNKPIPTPTSFDINSSIQRCLVKAIALHGLGIGIYAGEDLPVYEEEQPQGQGNFNPTYQEQTPQGEKPISPKQKELIVQRIAELADIAKQEEEIVIDTLKERVGDFQSIEKMTSLQASVAIKMLNKWKSSYEDKKK